MDYMVISNAASEKYLFWRYSACFLTTDNKGIILNKVDIRITQLNQVGGEAEVYDSGYFEEIAGEQNL